MWKRQAVAARVWAGGTAQAAQTAGTQTAPAQYPLGGTGPTANCCNVGAKGTSVPGWASRQGTGVTPEPTIESMVADLVAAGISANRSDRARG
ncbi:hypothetical protein [Arthrobacter psychrolactophilus]|uniref:hypothetical protein n=1 Tax=Arthrobacter psychrolactophilus TaxID=92442 RepID=UPI0011B83AF0|nr:hypothetical protein [Arthrobacter psychrolactophilus]